MICAKSGCQEGSNSNSKPKRSTPEFSARESVREIKTRPQMTNRGSNQFRDNLCCMPQHTTETSERTTELTRVGPKVSVSSRAKSTTWKRHSTREPKLRQERSNNGPSTRDRKAGRTRGNSLDEAKEDQRTEHPAMPTRPVDKKKKLGNFVSPKAVQFRKGPNGTPLEGAKMTNKSTSALLELWHREVKKERLSDTYRHHILTNLLDQEATWGNMWLNFDPGETRDNFLAAHCAVVGKMSDFSCRYKLKTKTLEASVLMLDKVLTSATFSQHIKGSIKTTPPAVPRTNSSSAAAGASAAATSPAEVTYTVQTIGMTLLFMQAKFEEIYPPPISTFMKWCSSGTDTSAMCTLERMLLLELGWNMTTATATDYLGWFFECLNVDKKTEVLSYYILESSYRAKLTEQIHGPVNRKWSFFNKEKQQQKSFPPCDLMESYPSKLALGALCLSLAYQGKKCFPRELEALVGMTSFDLGPLMKQLHDQLRAVVHEHITLPCPTIKKFSMRRYMQIGSFKPPTWLEMVQHNAFRESRIIEAVQRRMQTID